VSLLLALVLQAASPASGASVPTDRLIEGLRCAKDATQTYTLYLPPGYPGERTWPVLLVMDPRGRSVRAAERFVAAARELGFVLVSSNDTRSDTDPTPNVRALSALWPELATRVRTDPRRVYLAGFSGTGTLAFAVARHSGAIAGVIASGARWEDNHEDERLEFPCFLTAGDFDFNYAPIHSLHDRLRKWGTPTRLEMFEGEHSWMPEPLAREALVWMELQAMKAGLRPRDEGLVGRLLEDDVARAAALDAEGRVLEAARRYEAVAETFDGLAPVDAARAEAKRRRDLQSVRAARKDEEKWDRYEEKTLRHHREVYVELVSAPPPVPLERFVTDFGVDEIRRHAEAGGREGAAGRRLLNALGVETGFYIARDLRQRGEHARAAVALAVATQARPDRVSFWYDLACARSRAGFRGEALDALEEAVRRGFADREHLAADEDLARLRDEERFANVLDSLAGASASP